MNKTITTFHLISNSIDMSLVGRSPGTAVLIGFQSSPNGFQSSVGVWNPLGKTVLSKYSFIFYKWCVNICNNQAQKLKSNLYVGPVNICPNFSHCYFTPSEFIIQENCDHRWTEKPGNPMWSHFSGRCATLNWLNISRVSIHIRYHQCEKKNM